MDDIEKLKAENSDLRTKVDNFECNEYKLIRELEKPQKPTKDFCVFLKICQMDM